ncbi:MAG: PQQ-binding-like beta-propeller repeat protein [Gemmatales bacterium]|nr:PQQ-like beta-propeller repeat protein [Gemmatales bacterium]MCS7160747.1 PQQ-like beta-propeller repeat protein [Gemmatales bacterium]MDW8175948.1 PQQ-binding-like beta-propeller repeat protein [Gemmatales bacterium]MDW8224233.1 PQQ-binding-like beta-propeller repeat protein [Gemmatales bacterium]
MMLRTCTLTCIVALTVFSWVWANWPSFRGPTGNGHASAQAQPPLRWSVSQNVAWKIELPEGGNSTPAVWNDRIFLTQSLDNQGRERALLCLDRRTGKELWRQVVCHDEDEPTHRDNPACSASPATDGQRVVVSYGSAGVYCYDFQGKQLWHYATGKIHHIWGNAASPIIHDGMVFLNCGPGERTFLVALDLATGREVWKVDIPGGKFGEKPSDWLGAWSTPAIVRVGHRDLLVASWPEFLAAYEPKTGKEVWRCTGLGRLVYTSPVVSPEVVVISCGYGGPALAVRPDGQGDVTKSHQLWRTKERNPQRIGSGILLGDYFFQPNAAPGSVHCLEWRTGQVLWNERLGDVFWGSMVYAADRLYVTDKRAVTYVLKPAAKFELLAKNELDGATTHATPVIVDDMVLIRTWRHLWCLREPRP